MIKLNTIATIFLTFLKIGAFTFGGGYAMIPLIEREISADKKWITQEELMDIFAIAESTPGVIAVNTATFVGFKIAGITGAIFATLGVALPSFVIIFLISLFYQQFRELTIVDYAFRGIRIGVVALIISAVAKLSKSVPRNPTNIGIFSISFILVTFFGISAIYVILAAIMFGIVAGIVKSKRSIEKRQ